MVRGAFPRSRLSIFNLLVAAPTSVATSSRRCTQNVVGAGAAGAWDQY